MIAVKKNTFNKISLFVILLLFPFAQGFDKEESQTETSDKEEIERAIIGYIENFFLNDYEKMEVFLHDRLSKRGINADGSLNVDVSKQDLKTMMSNKWAMPLTMQKNTVSKIFIDKQHVATAVLDTGYPNTRWKEYINLAKIDGKWVLLDIFWCFENIEV
ncbi:MAG: nuclear transport factor 2 family protein [Balneolaceae bacterium]|nr:nuclear transport factor 2 family protein [Balneolaceae bacterium]MBO6545997.1 nuclear transport factor 2 family protein [Balneolaceae bacterium]MBO6647393.1 nuclear transport factor 2 family protein [Balneolaceae bacterium]